MFKIIGFQNKNLKFQDGREVSGITLHLIEQRENVTGYACESMFVSNSKLNGYVPLLDDLIEIRWNRWGKVESISHVKK